MCLSDPPLPFALVRYPQLALDYRDPEKDFDRRTVRGVVGKLFNLKDVNTATALEVTAGGRVRHWGHSGTSLV